ncbi:MAG: hypothetical protein EHM35_00115 [Planctomycetaceae bacterium]|nr:MAG: hypothetical protein EHM35_00115 [Planctomycetaceae bacterium]
MTQKSLHWDGASVGDAHALVENATDGIGYRLANADYESPFVDLALRMLLNGDENRGVLPGWLNELEVTGVATPVQVDTGGAVCYGMPYENTVAVAVAVPSPTTDVRQDRIVLRRDWAAQTVRITRVAGAEGGGVPALVQSPAPGGSGVYDVPLATLAVTTAGVIAVTDDREFCTFGTAPGTDAFGAMHITDASVDFIDRDTRDRIIFLGGGDLQPALTAGKWTIYGGSTVTLTGTAGWDGGANEQGWQITGSAYEGAVGSFRPPADYAGGPVSMYVWWVSNSALAATFSVRVNVQAYTEYASGGFSWNNIANSSVSIAETLVAHQVYRTAGPSWTDAPTVFAPEVLWYVMAYWNNPAGAEDINILGVEIRYTGYV